MIYSIYIGAIEILKTVYSTRKSFILLQARKNFIAREIHETNEKRKKEKKKKKIIVIFCVSLFFFRAFGVFRGQTLSAFKRLCSKIAEIYRVKNTFRFGGLCREFFSLKLKKRFL